MQIIFTFWGGLLSLGWGGVATDYAYGARRQRSLATLPPLEKTEDSPALSVVFAACNEAEKLPTAFPTLLAQEYPGGFQIVAADDRSTDTTGAILDGFADNNLSDKAITVLHIRDLPTGWLGKNHALWQAAQRATGEWLLFTDADIRFEPQAMSRAIHFAESEKLDFLVTYLQLDLHTFAEKVFGFCFTFLFLLRFRPWHMRNPRRSNYLGIGAFMLVRRTAYEAMGTHRQIALEVADDMELGRRLKRSGKVGDIVSSDGQVRIRWQDDGLVALMNGLSKNAYAGLNYSPLTAVLSSALLIGTVVLPFVGLFFGRSVRERGFHGLSVAAILGMGIHHARKAGLNPLYAATLPFSTFLLIYVMFRSLYLTETNGGITWRGTFYPLDLLRERPVPPIPLLVTNSTKQDKIAP